MAVTQLALALPLLLHAMSCCEGHDFYVGDRGGWRPKPAEPFNHWAERNRFQINDRLVFRYSKRDDSVLVVSQSHYDACNATDPYGRLEGGDSTVVLTHSGPYYFISGDAARCQDGERLIVAVLSLRNIPTPSPPPPRPKSSQSPPASPTPPPVPVPAPGSWPSHPPDTSTSSSPSPAPAPGTNGTVPRPAAPNPSSASALRGGVWMCLVIGAAMTLV